MQLDLVEDIFPMSDIQKGMAFHTLKDERKSIYHFQTMMDLNIQDFDFLLFQRTIKLLVNKHPILRTGFNLQSYEQPVQIVFKEVELNIEFHDLSHEKEDKEKQLFINNIIEKDKTEPFNFNNGEILWRIHLFAFGSQRLFLLWTSHHAITDGWSTASMFTEMNNLYLKLKKDSNFKPSKLNCSYKDYVIQEIVAKKKQENLDFWKNELVDYKKLVLPFKRNSEKNKRLKNKISQQIDSEIFKPVEKLTNKINVSIKHVCFAAYFYTLKMLSFENDIVAGLTVNNRPSVKDGDKILGCFLNSLPFRYEIKKDTTWKEFIVDIDTKMISLYKHGKLSFNEIVKVTNSSDHEGNAIFETMFNFINFHVYDKLDSSHLEKSESDNKQNLSFNTESYTNFQLEFEINYSNTGIVLTLLCVDLEDNLMNKIMHNFIRILILMANTPDDKIDHLNILSEDEKSFLLHSLNKNECDYPKNKPIHELFREQTKKTPDFIAIVSDDKSLSYRYLDERSTQLANYLISKDLPQNSVVGILLNRSIELMISILGIWKAGLCYLPIDIIHPQARKKQIVEASKMKYFISYADLINENLEILFNIPISNILSIDDGEYLSASKDYISPLYNSDELAYILYTSGSTGTPKGVKIKHSSLVNYICWAKEYYLNTGKYNMPLFTNICFDLTVTSLYLPIITGNTIIVYSDKNENNQFFDIINDSRLGIIKATPSIINLLLEMAEESNKLYLSKFIIGGENLAVKLSKKIKDVFGDYVDVYNEYGPTEATVGCIAHVYDKKRDIDKNVYIGSPIFNTQAYILDSLNNLQVIGVEGELCISGECLAQGYCADKEMTKEKFIHHPFKENELLYKTGDLARIKNDGTFECLGRIDDQVKIRGFRIELGEIENALLKHENIKETVVLSREENGDKYLCAYLVIKEDFNQEELRTYLSASLPDYMMPSYFVEMEKLPLNSNGKINRKVLPSPEVKAGDDYVAPENETEQKLVDIWSEVLKIPGKEIGVKTNFFVIGGHSLSALLAINKIAKQLSVEIPLSVFIFNSNIKQISNYISKQQKSIQHAIQIVEKKDYYPISPSQSPFYVFQNLEPNSTAFNVLGLLPITKEITFENILGCLNKIIEKHEAFRTAFIQKNNNIYQKIYDKVSFEIEKYEIKQSEREFVIDQFQRPFDLKKAPILRIGHVIMDNNSEFIIYDSHHILTDKITNEILLKDFNALIKNEMLNPLKIQYKDYSEWQNSKEQKNKIEFQRKYWLNVFNKDWTPIKLPTDFNRPEVLTTEDGTTVGTVYNTFNVEKIRKLTQQNNISVFMFFHSVVNIFLNKITGQSDFSIGTYTFGRNMPDLEKIVGVFINHVVVRNKFQIDSDFKSFLKETSERIIESFENQEYPYENLVNDLDLKRQSNHNPIFDIAVNYQEYDSGISEMEEKSFLIHKKGGGGVDLSFQILDFGEKIVLAIEYCDKLFMPQTIDRYLNYINTIVDSVLNKPNVKLSEIRIIDTPQINNESRSDVAFEF